MTLDPLLRDFLLAAVNFAAGYTYARWHVRNLVHRAKALTDVATGQVKELDRLMETKYPLRCHYCGHSSEYPHDPDCPNAKTID